MKHVLLLAVALMAVVVLTPAAFAQPPDGPSRPPRPPRPAGPLMEQLAGMGEADIRSLVETVRMVKLSRELGLTDEQTVVLVRQYNEAKESGAKLQKERMELARELRELVGAKAPDADIEQKLKQLVAKDRESVAMRLDAFEKAGAPLTPSQRAKLYLFLGDFDKRMRGLIETARKQFREQRGENVREMLRREGGPRRSGADSRAGREHDPQKGARPLPEQAPRPETPPAEQP
jgi:transposase-like protein